MKKCVIADSTALVLLAKLDLLDISASIFDISIPPSVLAETASERIAQKYPDVAVIRSLIKKGVVRVSDPGRGKINLPLTIHYGERDALLLALNEPGCLLATDDGKAIKAARFLKIPFIISPRIVIELFKRGKISLEKARISIEKLGRIGRYSPEIIAEAILSLVELKNGKANNC